MADFASYHALGQGGVPEDDKRSQHIRTDPAAPQFNPPVAPPPAGYAQAGSPYMMNQAPPQAPYGGVPQSPAAYQQGTPYGGQVGGLTNQMAGLGIGADTGTVRSHKKKGRHAYHEIGTGSGAAQAFAQPQMQPAASPYLDTSPTMQPPTPISPYGPSPHLPGQVPQVRPGVPGTGDGSVPTQGKVDPEQIPSVPRSRDVAAQYYLDHVYPTMEHHLPPPATIPFLAHDQGNSSPKFARLTLNNVPASAELLASTALPLGMVLQPLAKLAPGEQPVPVLDFGETGPPRCRRCRAYVNPFMVFKSGGNRLVCNMCLFPNDVPPDYFAPLDMSGTRVDRLQRPELMLGTVDFMVPKAYWGNEPVGLRWLFVIDVSQEAVVRGFLEACCEGIMAALYGSDDQNEDENGDATARRLPEGSRVGIITFDKDVHFYNLSVGSQIFPDSSSSGYC